MKTLVETAIKIAQTQTDFDEVNKVMETLGYELNPDISNGKPIRLENAVIYHLIKYTEEEKQALEQEEPQPEVESVKSVSYDEVDGLISNGYQPKDYYAKSVVMVKMKSQEENTAQTVQT